MAQILKSPHDSVEATVELNVSEKDMKMLQRVNPNVFSVREEKTDKLLFAVSYKEGEHELGNKTLQFGQAEEGKLVFVYIDHNMTEKAYEDLQLKLGNAQYYVDIIETQVKEALKKYAAIKANVTIKELK